MIANGAADRLFRAFSDRTRLRILHLLGPGELCVGDIMTALRLPQAKTSRHLGYLRRAGLVRAREEGLWCFYSLARPTSRLHRSLLRCLGACVPEMPEFGKDFRSATELKKKGGCCPR